MFAPAGSGLKIDPRKRVKYSTGLVLGLDEFLQEQTYFLEKDRSHVRNLHGYGVVCGLDVSSRGDTDPEVVVAPGIGIEPRGRVLTVDQAYCVRINAWLQRHRADVEAQLGSPGLVGSPALADLYLVLCHRECETDVEPIPSGPCQSLDKVTAATRIADDFVLELRTTPPDQTEEDAIRALGALLRSIEIAAGPAPLLTEEELVDLVRALGPGSALPASPAPGSPGTELRIHPDDADYFLRAALRVWSREVRPVLLPDGRNCHRGPPRDACIQLARVGVPLALVAGELRVNGPLSIDPSKAPTLIQTRLLQEQLSFGTGGGVSEHAALTGLDQDDHPQYLLVDPASRALVADLDAAGNRIVGLSPGTAAGESVVFQQAIKVGDAAGGDLAQSYPDPHVVRLQGRPVAAAAPNADDVLTWTGSQWVPRPVQGGDGQPTNFEPGLTRLRTLSWPHSAVHHFRLRVDGEERLGAAIAFTNGIRVAAGSLDSNSFQVFIEILQDVNGLIPVQRGLAQVLPVKIVGMSGDLITEVVVVGGPEAEAALLLFDDRLAKMLSEADGAILRIVLHGDVVRDVEGRSIDAELLRTELPSGDRPAASDIGLQGGRFESWAAFRPRDGDNFRLDLNLASRDDLIALPAIGVSIADRILELRRERGAIRSIEDLESLRIPTQAFNQLRRMAIIR
jgi:hypothetical protein